MEISISDHARLRAQRRKVPIDIITSVAISPEQVVYLERGRIVCQSKLFDPILGKEMLFRIIVEDKGNIREVITAYKTSKVGKYWEGDENNESNL